jgi:hypothetical protein
MAPPRNRQQSALRPRMLRLQKQTTNLDRGGLTGSSRRRARSDLLHMHMQHAHDGRHGVNRRPTAEVSVTTNASQVPMKAEWPPTIDKPQCTGNLILISYHACSTDVSKRNLARISACRGALPMRKLGEVFLNRIEESLNRPHPNCSGGRIRHSLYGSR